MNIRDVYEEKFGVPPYSFDEGCYDDEYVYWLERLVLKFAKISTLPDDDVQDNSEYQKDIKMAMDFVLKIKE